MSILVDLNWTGGIIGTVLTFLLGWVWYSEKMFGEAYAKLLNIDITNCNKTPVLALVLTFLYRLIFAILIMFATTFIEFWLLVFLLILMSSIGRLTDILWAQKDLKIWQISASYDALGILIIALCVQFL